MREEEYLELTRQIQTRIYRHTHGQGSETTREKRKARADEDIQILRIIEDMFCRNMKS